MGESRRVYNAGKKKVADAATRGALNAADNMGNGLGAYDGDPEDEYREKEQQKHNLENRYDDIQKTKRFLDEKKSKKAVEETVKRKVKKKGTKKIATAAAKKGSKGIFKAIVSALGKVFGAVGGKIVLIVLIVILVVAIIFMVLSAFEDGDYEEENRELDTRGNSAVKYVTQKEKLKEIYAELINNAASDEEKQRLKNNYQKIMNSDEFFDFQVNEGKENSALSSNSNKNIYLNIERLCYAYGGYLNWTPDYLDSGVNVAKASSVTVNDSNMKNVTPICKEIGAKYAIDPAILLAIIEVESGGDFHHNAESTGLYKGLVSMPEKFNKFFESSEEEYFYSETKRIPEDIGSCVSSDRNHIDAAKLNIEYLARKLTGEMTYFLQEAKNVDFVVDEVSNSDLREAILYSIAAYNQGEFLQMDFYKTHKGKDIYGNNGTTYTELFKKSMINNGKKVGTKLTVAQLSDGFMKEDENSNYLERVYKAYEKYKGKSLDTAANNFDYSELAYKWYDKHFAYRKSYADESTTLSDVAKSASDIKQDIVRLSDDSSEKELVEEIQKQFQKQELIDNIKQYNTWTKMIDDYYYSIKPSVFFKINGNRVPELYAKDEYGVNTNTVIKYQSCIHNIVDSISRYTATKEFLTGSIESDYNQLKTYLDSEKVEGTPQQYVKLGEKLAGLEKEYAIEIDDLVSESLQNVLISLDITDEENIDKVVDVLSKYLAYAIPMYEYVTLDRGFAGSSFMDYEIYSKSAYNDKYELIVDKDNISNMLEKINKINIPIAEYLEGKKTANDVKNAEKELYKYMYLSDNRFVSSNNHYFDIPANKNEYYINKNGIYCDEYIENVITYEVYEDDVPAGTTVVWNDTSDTCGNIPYKGLKADVIKEFVTANLKPQKFTSLLDREISTFTYKNVSEGSRKIPDKAYAVNCEKGTLYKTDEAGNSVECGTIYRKIVIKSNTYIEKQEREKVKTDRK